MPRTLIDLDGVCFDPYTGINASIQWVFLQMLGEGETRDSVSFGPGESLEAHFESALKPFPGYTVTAALRLFARHYAVYGHQHWQLFPGVAAVLDRLQREQECQILGFTSRRDNAITEWRGLYPSLSKLPICPLDALSLELCPEDAEDTVVITNKLHLAAYAARFRIGTIFTTYGHASWRYLRAAGAMLLASAPDRLPALAKLYFARCNRVTATF